MRYYLNNKTSFCRELLSSYFADYWNFPMDVHYVGASIQIPKRYIPFVEKSFSEIFGIEIKRLETDRFLTNIWCKGRLETPFDIGALFYILISNVNPENPMIESPVTRRTRQNINLSVATRLYLAFRKAGKLRNLDRIIFPSYGGGPESLMHFILLQQQPSAFLDASLDDVEDLLEQFSTYFFKIKKVQPFSLHNNQTFTYDENGIIILRR